MSLKHLKVLDEDDEDPMLSAVNLVDVFLVLVVALLAAVAASTRPTAAQAPEPTLVHKAGEPDMEIVVTEQGREVRYKGSGGVSEGEGVRAGVAYRLRDGSIIYVPEDKAQDDSPTAGVGR
ncbi:MAG: DUF2149 domain-containing protein [Azoarcus sp.]|nr:DUF2149 domain-containing protein [Azoarcus sp.]